MSNEGESETDKLNKLIDALNNLELPKHIEDNLSSYISNALRITNYLGSLRIKYVTFNFTFLALFASVLTFSIQIIKLSEWYIILPTVSGFVIYFIIFIINILPKYRTTSFDHKNLSHYSCLMEKEEYPNIKADHITNFRKLFEKKGDKYLIKCDLRTLITQYFHQANHDKIGSKMRKHLIQGIIIFAVAVLVSFFLFIFSPVINSFILYIITLLP